MRVVKEKFKMTTTRVKKECNELRYVNMVVAEVLERETKRAQNKFRGAFWGSNSELRLRRAGRDVKGGKYDIRGQVEGLSKVKEEFDRTVEQDEREYVDNHWLV